MILLQNKVDQVLGSPQHLNSSTSLPSKMNPHRSTVLEVPSSLIDSATHQTAARINFKPVLACVEGYPSVRGSDTALAPAPSSATSLAFTKVLNNFRDVYHFGTRIVSAIAAPGSATPLPG